MKKLGLIILSIFLLVFSYNVSAKDTVYSLNKHQDEKFNFIKSSYNNKGVEDGFVTGGTYLKENNKEDNNSDDNKDYQIMLVKYNRDGQVKWKYTYGKTKEDKIDYLEYTYDTDNNINGYLIVLEKTYNIGEESQDTDSSRTTFLKVGLDGKLVYEKTSALSNNEKIEKIIPITNNENKIDSYIAIGKIENQDVTTGIIIKYDLDLNIIWSKEYKKDEYKEINYLDITPIYSDKNVIGYAILRELISQENTTVELVKYNLDGDEETVINNLDLDKYNNYYLEKANNGFIFYGITKEVKLKKGDSSYYIINYNINNEEEWETIGNTPLNDTKKIVLLPIEKENVITKYLLLYTNTDSSNEVIELNLEGSLVKKIKKIKNDYYDFENFRTYNEVLYLVGQINCPEDDECDYDKNSLFLISDEDKVIEVEDKDSQNILLIIVIIVVVISLLVFIKSRKKTK